MYCWELGEIESVEGGGWVLVVGRGRLGCDALVGAMKGRIDGRALGRAVEFGFEKGCDGRFREVVR